MDEKPVDHPGVPTEVYHTLGVKTFWISLLSRIQGSVIILLVAIGLFAIHGQPFLLNTPVGDANGIVALVGLLALALFIIVFLITFFASWLIYKNFKFFLGEDALKIKQGIFNKHEMAIPYRQIQNVDLTRDISFQLLGLSRIVILTAGEEEDRSGEDESEGVFPAIDKDLAEWLQQELLRRANVQKVTATGQ